MKRNFFLWNHSVQDSFIQVHHSRFFIVFFSSFIKCFFFFFSFKPQNRKSHVELKKKKAKRQQKYLCPHHYHILLDLVHHHSRDPLPIEPSSKIAVTTVVQETFLQNKLKSSLNFTLMIQN